MKEKILYISDLDGTLLRTDQTVSEFTARTVCSLVRRGMLFSYATARSYTTSSKVTKGLPEKLPVIVFNGSFIVETGTQRRLLSRVFTEDQVSSILDFLIGRGLYPIVNAFFEDKEKFSYCRGKETKGVARFIRERYEDVRRNPVALEKELYKGEVFHITCIDEEEKLRLAYDEFKEKYPCVCYRDMYSGDMWLEIHPMGATKANAVLALKEMLGCKRVVCFGDGENDLSMFAIADECYAVANAHDALKAIATSVIGSNENDGVAVWLSQNAKFDEK